jgi:hypothetical protein
MKNLTVALQNLINTEVKESNGKVHQVQSRAIKTALLSALMTDLTDNGFNVGKVEKGFIAQVGAVVLNFDIAIKPLDFDFESAIQKELERLAEIQANKQAKSKKSAK